MAHNSSRSAFPLVASLLVPALTGLGLAHCSSSSGGSGGPGVVTPGRDAATDGAEGDGTAGDAGSHADGGAPAEAGDGGAEASPGIPCEAGACSGSLTCCSDFCVDLGHDPRNCGACGQACTATQFCTGTRCDEAVFTNACANGAVTVVTDPFAVDTAAGMALGTALQSCSDAGATLTVAAQTQAGVLEQDAGEAGAWRPILGVGNTLVAAGGSYGQLAVGYLDSNGLTRAYVKTDGVTVWVYQRSTNVALVTTSFSGLNAHHDFFLLELAVEPQSGTLSLIGQGFLAPGTSAAAYYGSQVVIPSRASYPDAYYAYEWTDTNMDGTPNAGDSYNQVAAGN